jgi:hypothetical protein
MSEVIKQPTAEQIAGHYSALLDSVNLINQIIANTETHAIKPEAEKKDSVERNVVHLELMRAKDFWTIEDFTSVDATIVAGKAYIN